MIVAVGSWRGTGGTTTAFALAAAIAHTLGTEAWLVEADPAGGVLSGRVQLAPYAVGGLERVAFPTERNAPVEALHEVAQYVGDVRIVAAPADPFRAHSCHQPRSPWRDALGELPGNVVIDVGRLRAGTPVGPLVQLADELLLVTSAEVSAAVATDEWVGSGGRVAASESGMAEGSCRVVVVDAPGGIAFPKAGLLADLGERAAGWLPWEPAAVDALQRGVTFGDRRLRRSRLAQAGCRVAEGLRARVVTA